MKSVLIYPNQNMKKTLFTLLAFSIMLTGCSLTPGQQKTAAPNQDLEEKVSPEEEEFNNSGQAKAIEDETDLWQLYDNSEVGISFQYPWDVILLDEGTSPESDKTYLDIDIRNIGEVELPTDVNEEDAMENIEALTSGEFGKDSDFAFEASKQVKAVGFLFAQDYMTLARFEVCDVTLERKLRFYFNNKQITLTLHGPVDSLKKTMPDYFTVDSTNCGEEKIWNFEKQHSFYQELVAGNGSEEVQIWFDNFDQIAETVIFAHR